MYLEMCKRLDEIKNHIENDKQLTKEELADTLTIALTFEKLIHNLHTIIKKERNTR